MANYSLTLEERETVLRTNDVPGSDWDFWTFSERRARKLRKLGYDLKENPQGGWWCRIPANRITIRRPDRRKSAGRPFQSKSRAISRVPQDQELPAIVG